jgi:2-dehydropantoate 2-reductase
MKIGVVGPGALGCLFAALLARAGHQVWLVDHRPERAKLIEAQGIELHDLKGRHTVPVRVTVDPAQIGPVQLLLLCVKSGDAVSAARNVLPILGTGGLLIALQNGIAHHPQLMDLLPHPWALGITAQGANLLSPGLVRHGGSGLTAVGFLAKADDSATPRLQEAADLLNRAGVSTVISSDILAEAWNKLIVNVGINALTVLEDCTNGELLGRPDALAIMRSAVQEAALVASASGIIIAADPLAMTIAVCRQTQDNISSMLQDIRHGRSTEVEAINGVIVCKAATLGIPVPANQALLAGVKALEGKGLIADSRRPEDATTLLSAADKS